MAESPTGIYYDSKGRDLYDKRQPLYYVFQVMQVLYGLGFVAYLVLIMNANVPHSHVYAGNFGPLYSERYTGFYWLALMFSTFRLFIFITSASMLLYRRTSCCCGKPGNQGCGGFWAILLTIFVLFDVLVLAMFGGMLTKCNAIGAGYNPCNDLRYCHVPEVYNDPGSHCTYMTMWLPPVAYAELGYNVDFLWLFSLSVVYLAFDLVFLFVPISLWIKGTTKITRITADGVEEDGVEFDVLEETQEDATETIYLPAGARIDQKALTKQKLKRKVVKNRRVKHLSSSKLE